MDTHKRRPWLDADKDTTLRVQRCSPLSLARRHLSTGGRRLNVNRSTWLIHGVERRKQTSKPNKRTNEHTRLMFIECRSFDADEIFLVHLPMRRPLFPIMHHVSVLSLRFFICYSGASSVVHPRVHQSICRSILAFARINAFVCIRRMSLISQFDSISEIR